MAAHALRRGVLLLLVCASLSCRVAALTAMADWESGFATFYGALVHVLTLRHTIAPSAVPARLACEAHPVCCCLPLRSFAAKPHHHLNQMCRHDQCSMCQA